MERVGLDTSRLTLWAVTARNNIWGVVEIKNAKLFQGLPESEVKSINSTNE